MQKIKQLYQAEKASPRKNPSGEFNVCVFDDDPAFRTLMEVRGSSVDVTITCFPALHSIPHLRDLINYDALVIDYYLEDQTGVQVSQYICSFFPDIPVVLISGEFLTEHEKWPENIKGFFPKGLGADQIVRETLSMIS